MTADFQGPRVVRAAFVLAAFGWGCGFYGPPIFVHAVQARTGWSLALVSWAVTLHHLAAALLVLRMPLLHARWGLAAVASGGMVAGAIGILGWSWAGEPWQLMLAAMVSGCGWGCTGAAAVTAAIAAWYRTRRASALTTAYNGASVGGALFSVGWSTLIATLGFTTAALVLGSAAVFAVAGLCWFVLRWTPQRLGQFPDGLPPVPDSLGTSPEVPSTRSALMRDRRLRVLGAAMALALFAQIGLLAHLYSLLVPSMRASGAGWVVGSAVAWAIAGRWLGRNFGFDRGAHPCAIAAAFLTVQALGSLLLAVATPGSLWLVLAGCLLIGLGIGNATSLPPIAAHHLFAARDASQAVALIVAIAQAGYAFAPAAFGALLERYPHAKGIAPGSAVLFAVAAALQLAAAGAMLYLRRFPQADARAA